MRLARANAVSAKRVLIVDQHAETARVLGDSLSGAVYACELVPTGDAALLAAKQRPFEIVIATADSTGMVPLELLDRLELAHTAPPVMLVAAMSEPVKSADAAALGAFRFLSSQHDFNELQTVLARELRERTERAAARSGASWGAPITRQPHAGALDAVVADSDHAALEVGGGNFGLIGSGPVMRALRDCIDRVAATSSPVLILGESGSGKELVARAIHERGPRRKRPLVTVNVAAIAEQLLDSEMFGHVRGAFTGANQARAGLFASADGGTLFLDEIGEMPLGLQAKLLRVLETGELRPVGGDIVRHVDVRVLAATHRDLLALVAENRFREDLYFRLNVLPVLVSPLRARQEDIAELTAHFLVEAQRRTPTSVVRTIDADAIALLSHAVWPGNVRELASVIERLVVMEREAVITPQHLAFLPERARSLPPGTPVVPLSTLAEVTDGHVAKVLEYTKGNKRLAASILGVDLSTLYRWQSVQHKGLVPASAR